MIKTVSFRTLGCRLNHSESDSIQFEFQSAGFTIVNNKTPADLTIINSCAVTRQAEAKTRGAIAAARRISSQGKIMVVGCYSQLSPDDLMDLKGVDLVLGNSEKYRIREFLGAIEKGQREIRVGDTLEENTFPPAGVISMGDRTRAQLKVQDGCDYKCSYCVVPLLRGRTRSRDFQACIDETKMLVDHGYKEIVLSGINIGSYRTEAGQDFTDLVEGILEKTAIRRLRISSIEPDLISDRLISIMRDEARLCRHFHIPLQHGSNEILGWMRRRYRIESYRETVAKIADQVPDVCIGTDVLVGYPGETDKHFQEMADVLQRLPIAYYHVFRFSFRPGTPASRIKSTVSPSVKKERSELLRKLSKSKKVHYVRGFSGKELSVLFEKKTKLGLYEGLSDNYITVNVKSKEPLINRIKKIAITQVNGATARGEITRD